MNGELVIRQGQYNEIPPETFRPFDGDGCGPIIIGDCNTIHEGVRILVGAGGFKMGDWNTIHNHCTIGGPGRFVMGHNCWIGQECYLDTTGTLMLGSGVTLGVRTSIWTHVGRGEQVEGWIYNVEGQVVLLNEVWLMGDNVHVAPGVTMGERSAALAHAVITHDTEMDGVYAGIPAQKVSVNVHTPKTIEEKMALMAKWVEEFCGARRYPFGIQPGSISFNDGRFCVTIFAQAGLPSAGAGSTSTVFDMTIKTYTKKLSPLEIDFIRFLKANRARFTPR